MRTRLLQVTLTLAVLTLGGVGATLALASAGRRSPAHASGGRGLSVTFPFTQTNAGTQHGSTITGVEGHGTFSAALGTHAGDLALIALATGIPFNQLAQGGTYGARFTIGATGTNTGTVVARFKANGLGSICFAFTAKGGRFQTGDSFVPTSGTIAVLGGTGAAARWSVAGSYLLKTITGSNPETFTFSGTFAY